jgi:hypothetical protein
LLDQFFISLLLRGEFQVFLDVYCDLVAALLVNELVVPVQIYACVHYYVDVLLLLLFVVYYVHHQLSVARPK